MSKMGHFIENLQKSFCLLFVFCSVLLQEGKVISKKKKKNEISKNKFLKEIENLKNFLMSHVLQTANELKMLKNQNEDNKELFFSQKKVNF